MVNLSVLLVKKAIPEIDVNCKYTMQSFYNTPHYNTNLDITWSCSGYQIFYHGILQRNYWKMTMNPKIPFVKLSLYNTTYYMAL